MKDAPGAGPVCRRSSAASTAETSAAPGRLIVAAHGSRDPGFAAVVEAIADQVAKTRPELSVQYAYLDHGSPRLSELSTAGAVIVPLLLSNGFHVTADIPETAPEAIVTHAVGPDWRLTAVVVDRLRAAGWQHEEPVVLAAAGSSEADALDDVRVAAQQLGELLAVEVTAAFVTGGEPRLDQSEAAAVATYVLAPGFFADRIAEHGAAITSAPIGADSRVAEVVISRYEEAPLSWVGSPEVRRRQRASGDNPGARRE